MGGVAESTDGGFLLRPLVARLFSCWLRGARSPCLCVDVDVNDHSRKLKKGKTGDFVKKSVATGVMLFFFFCVVVWCAPPFFWFNT